MKRDELIKILLDLPHNAEIRIRHDDDIQGFYEYLDPYITESEAYENSNGSIYSVVSNWIGKDPKKTKIWSLN